MRNPLPDLLALFFTGIFLFVFVEQNQQVNVALLLQVQVQITAASALALAAARIRGARLADATQARNHCAPVRLARKLFLNRSEHFVGIVACELMKLPRERPGFDEFHIVIVPQCSMQWQRMRNAYAAMRFSAVTLK